MANTNDQFQEYLSKIRLTAAKKDNLRGSRDANRKRIRKHFTDVLGKPAPKFHGQGSSMMHTNLNPIAPAEYDLDDGVYLQGLGTDQSQWPTSNTVHKWVADAVEGATETVKDKPRCVRVHYRPDYHVDLPIYAENADGVPMLFEKGKAPYVSDPKAFTDWFDQQVSAKGSQLKPVVRYLKGWRAFQRGDASLASGLALTILATERFVKDDRDDVALVNVLGQMVAHLENGSGICKPVAPYEDLTDKWSEAQRTNFTAKLRTFWERGKDALAEEDLAVATGIWHKLFGDRYPVVKSKNDDTTDGPLKTDVPVVIPAKAAQSA